MSLRFIQSNKIEKHKWDECVRTSKNRSAYGLTWFLDSITDKWCGIVLNDYEAVMPLVVGKKFCVSYIYQPSYYQRTSIYSCKLLTQDKIDVFYKAIPKKFVLHEFSVDKYALPSSELNYDIIQMPNLILDLSTNYTELSNEYSGNTKRNIKKAIQSELTISSSTETGKIIDAFNQNRGQKLLTKPSNFEQLSQLMETSFKKGAGLLLEATQGGSYAGGIYFLHAFNRWTLLFVGSNELSKLSGAVFAMIDHFIKRHAESADILDFEGSINEGVARFYRGFGSQKEKYFALKKDNTNKLIKLAKRLRSK